MTPYSLAQLLCEGDLHVHTYYESLKQSIQHSPAYMVLHVLPVNETQDSDKMFFHQNR